MILACNELRIGEYWRRQSEIAAAHLIVDNTHPSPRNHDTPKEMSYAFKHRDNYTIADDVAAPIDHWVSGAGGQRQRLAAKLDMHPGKIMMPRVRIPEPPIKTSVTIVNRSKWEVLDFHKDNANLQVNNRCMLFSLCTFHCCYVNRS